MNIRNLLLAALLLCSINYTIAQQPKQYKAVFCGSVALKDIPDKYNVSIANLEMPEVDGKDEQSKLNALKAQSRLRFPLKAGKASKKTTTAPDPIVAINFVADSFSGIPPDNYMAINKSNRAVSVINQSIAVHDATTGAYLYRKSLNIFSSAIGLSGTDDYRFDPKVVYDPEADKFICVLLSGINQFNYIVLGFSATNDPAGTWNFYKFYGDYTGDTTWFDYPAISITKNEFFLTGNKIIFDSSWQAGFRRTLIYQVRKADGYNGNATLGYQIWDSVTYGGKNLRCLYPLNPGSQLESPSQYFLSNRNFSLLNDTVFLIKVPDTIGGSGSLSVTPIISSLSYGAPPDGRQTDTTLSLATNDGRVLGGFINGNEIQFVSNSVNPLNGAASIYHGVISNYSSTPSLTGRIFSIDSLDFGYPNISFTGVSGGHNQSIITCNFSGPNRFPGFGAVFFDGSSFSNLVTIKEGISKIYQLLQKQQRWGDYSGSQPDWNIQGAVWAEGIFGARLKRYGCYMAQIYSPYFTGVKELPAKPTAKLYPNPAFEYIKFEFNVLKPQVINFFIYDIQGKIVDKLVSQHCKEGENVMEFNIATLAPGTYFVKGEGELGEKIATTQFTRK